MNFSVRSYPEASQKLSGVQYYSRTQYQVGDILFFIQLKLETSQKDRRIKRTAGVSMHAFVYQISIRTYHVPVHQCYDKDYIYNNRQGKNYSASQSLIVSYPT